MMMMHSSPFLVIVIFFIRDIHSILAAIIFYCVVVEYFCFMLTCSLTVSLFLFLVLALVITFILTALLLSIEFFVDLIDSTS